MFYETVNMTMSKTIIRDNADTTMFSFTSVLLLFEPVDTCKVVLFIVDSVDFKVVFPRCNAITK